MLIELRVDVIGIDSCSDLLKQLFSDAQKHIKITDIFGEDYIVDKLSER